MAVVTLGEAWRRQRVGSEVFHGAAYLSGSDRWVICGGTSGPVMLTAEGSEVFGESPVFTSRSVATAEIFRAAAASPTQVLAVTEIGEAEISADGISWSNEVVDGVTTLLAVGYGPVTPTFGFVAVGVSAIFTRNIFTTWTQTDSQATTWTGVAYASSGGWVAVDINGDISTSAFGASWTAAASISPRPLNAIAASGTTYMAVGDFGTAFFSADASVWTSRPIGDGQSAQAVVSLGGQRWAASTAQGRFYVTEDDGATWVQVSLDWGTSINAMGVGAPVSALSAGVNGSAFVSVQETQIDAVPVAPPVPGPALADNPAMVQDAVRRLVSQFRSGS